MLQRKRVVVVIRSGELSKPSSKALKKKQIHLIRIHVGFVVGKVVLEHVYVFSGFSCQ
jgi:hypothetical protein